MSVGRLLRSCWHCMPTLRKVDETEAIDEGRMRVDLEQEGEIQKKALAHLPILRISRISSAALHS